MTTLRNNAQYLSNYRRIAVIEYIKTGSPQAAWNAIRRLASHRRAKHWDECIYKNTGCVRNYSCPLGEELEIFGAQGIFGSHSAKYRRTIKSLNESEKIKEIVIDWLERESMAYSEI